MTAVGTGLTVRRSYQGQFLLRLKPVTELESNDSSPWKLLEKRITS